ncbi:ferredoxin family protein [Parabacteroides sp. OttesenSCG-928-G07]|nr:ferredoxin family protein [Parabacteroides sp. OttesenSCG-928-G07]
MQDKRVTICACASRGFIDKDKVAEVAAILKDQGYAVRIEADLCKMIMQKDPAMEEIASSVIVACYPRAVRSLLDTMGLVPGRVLDIRNEDTQTIYGELEVEALPAAAIAAGKERVRQEIGQFPVEEGTDAWYPALDKEKCIECGKCHDFCLFGVYTITDKKVKVVQPQNCKNNCPACARMCPSKAIIFPKYEKSPINGGMDMEEQFDAQEMETLYRERLRYRLQERRAGVSLLKGDKQ